MSYITVRDDPTSWDAGVRGEVFHREEDVLVLEEGVSCHIPGLLYIKDDVSGVTYAWSPEFKTECLEGQARYTFLVAHLRAVNHPPPISSDEAWRRLSDPSRNYAPWTQQELIVAAEVISRPLGVHAAFTSKATGNWSTEGQTTWTEVGHPVAGDTVSIGAHTITVDVASACASITFSAAGTLACGANAVTMTSTFTLNATGTLTASTGGLTGCTACTFNNVVTCSGASAFSVAGNVTISGTFTYSTSVITTTAAGAFNSSVSIYSWTHNASAATQTLTTNGATLAGKLTITAGTVDTGADLALTVTGATAAAGTLTCKASTVSLGSGADTATWMLAVTSTGTFTGGTGTHTIGSIWLDGGSVTLSSGATTINGRYAGGWNHCMDFNAPSTFSHGNGSISFTYAGEQLLRDTNNTAQTFNNFTVDKSAGNTLQFFDAKGFAITVAGTLTITSGTFIVADKTSNTSRNLTVTGTSGITGTCTPGATSTLTLNGAVTVNSGGTVGANSAWTWDLNSTLAGAGTVSSPTAAGGFTWSGATWTIGTYTNNGVTLTADGAVAQALTGTGHTFAFIRITNSTDKVTITGGTISGTSGAAWNEQQVQVGTGAKGQLKSVTATTVGLQATSGWMVSFSHGGVATDTRYWGALNTNAADSGYQAADWTSTMVIQVRVANVYGTAFDTTITLNESATCAYIQMGGSTDGAAKATMTVSSTYVLQITQTSFVQGRGVYAIASTTNQSTFTNQGTIRGYIWLGSGILFDTTASPLRRDTTYLDDAVNMSKLVLSPSSQLDAMRIGGGPA